MMIFFFFAMLVRVIFDQYNYNNFKRTKLSPKYAYVDAPHTCERLPTRLRRAYT